MLHSAANIVETSSIEGLGFIASARILAGEIVWQLDPDEYVYTLEDIALLTPEEQADFEHFGFQCGERTFIYCKGIDRYTNHSCDPNTWWKPGDVLTLVACRNIEAGQEITYDYSTSDILIPYEMPCRCGTAHCRGVITNLDYLSPTWQQRYGNSLPQHVLKAMQEAPSS